MVYSFFEGQRAEQTGVDKKLYDKVLGRKTGKVYSNPPRQPQTTSSPSAPKPKVGAEKLSDLSQRLKKAVSKIVGESTVATKKKTPSKTVKPKKKTPTKKKTTTKSKTRGGGGVGNINITKPLTTPRNRQLRKKPFDV